MYKYFITSFKVFSIKNELFYNKSCCTINYQVHEPTCSSPEKQTAKIRKLNEDKNYTIRLFFNCLKLKKNEHEIKAVPDSNHE